MSRKATAAARGHNARYEYLFMQVARERETDSVPEVLAVLAAS